MSFPASTAVFAAIFALIYVGFSAWVASTRVQIDTLHGDGGNATLAKRIRAHGNFGEYVPFALLLLALFEAGGGSLGLTRALLVVLLISRVAHPFGMFAPKNSPQQFACRGGGILGTLLVIGITAIGLLILVG